MRSELYFPLMAKEADSQRGPRLAQVLIASKWQNGESHLRSNVFQKFLVNSRIVSSATYQTPVCFSRIWNLHGWTRHAPCNTLLWVKKAMEMKERTHNQPFLFPTSRVHPGASLASPQP